MHLHLFILLVSCCFVNTFGGSMPSFLKPCSASDPELNQCISKQIQSGVSRFADGLPELGIAPLDPASIGTVNVNSAALKLTFTDAVLLGLKGLKLNTFKISLDKGKALIDFVANVTLKTNYVMDGQVLILPIKGEGPAKIKITNLNIVIRYDFINKDDYWDIQSYKDSYKMERAQFKFNNLFGGRNKELAEATHKFTNDNWSVIMEEIAPPAMKQIIKKCVEEANKFFKAVPTKELILP